MKIQAMQTTLRARELSTRLRSFSFRREWLIILLGAWVAWWAGSAVATGGSRASLAVMLSGAALGGTVVWALARGHVMDRFLSVEAPVLLLLASSLVFRIRDADSLAQNPLDTAGLFRVGCQGLALLLAGLALTSDSKAAVDRVTSRPFRFYCAYLVVVFLGAPVSVNLPLTAYRGVDLLIGVLVVAAAYRAEGQSSVHRIERVIYWWTAALAVSAWIGVLFFPGQALTPIKSPLPWQLRGVLPAISANGLGSVGVVLFIWSLGLLVSPRELLPARRSVVRFMVALGFLSLLFAQYRTGYISAAVGLLVLVLLRGKLAGLWALAAVVVVLSLWGAVVFRQAGPVALRGQTIQRAEELSSRIDWWRESIPVWRESPLIGRGLLTATRFEVLARIGRTTTSTIHGTWVEALVGTGIIGVGFLAAFALVLLNRAFKEALRRDGRIVPLLILSIVLVRSATGSTFEASGSGALLVLALALYFRDSPRVPIRPRQTESQGTSESSPDPVR